MPVSRSVAKTLTAQYSTESPESKAINWSLFLDRVKKTKVSSQNAPFEATPVKSNKKASGNNNRSNKKYNNRNNNNGQRYNNNRNNNNNSNYQQKSSQPAKASNLSENHQTRTENQATSSEVSKSQSPQRKQFRSSNTFTDSEISSIINEGSAEKVDMYITTEGSELSDKLIGNDSGYQRQNRSRNYQRRDNRPFNNDGQNRVPYPYRGGRDREANRRPFTPRIRLSRGPLPDTAANPWAKSVKVEEQNFSQISAEDALFELQKEANASKNTYTSMGTSIDVHSLDQNTLAPYIPAMAVSTESRAWLAIQRANEEGAIDEQELRKIVATTFKGSLDGYVVNSKSSKVQFVLPILNHNPSFPIDVKNHLLDMTTKTLR